MSKVKGLYPFQKTDAEYFQDVVHLQEATHQEQFMFWKVYFEDANRDLIGIKSWRQGAGVLVHIGELAGAPVNIVLSWDFLNEKKVIFYEAVSQVVDYRMVEAWLKHFAPNISKSSSSNFHLCLHEIREKKTDVAQNNSSVATG